MGDLPFFMSGGSGGELVVVYKVWHPVIDGEIIDWELVDGTTQKPDQIEINPQYEWEEL